MTDDFQDREWPRRRKIQVLGGGAGVVAALAIALYATQPTPARAAAPFVAASLAPSPAAAPPAVPAPAEQPGAASPAPTASPPTMRAPAATGPATHLAALANRRTGSALLRTTRYSTSCVDPDHDRDCDSHSRRVLHVHQHHD